MASPLCSVDGSSEHIAHATTYGATVNLALLSTLGVNAVDFVVVGVSNSTLTIPTITEGALGTASFTFPADPSDAMGRSVLVEIIVNGGFDQHGKQSPALRTRVLIGVANANGVIPIASDESMERDAITGWLRAINESLGAPGGRTAANSVGCYALTGGADMALVHSYEPPAITSGQALVFGFRVTAKNDDLSAIGFAETTIPALLSSGVFVLGDIDWSALLPYGWDVSVASLVGSAGVGVSVMPGAVNGTVLVEIWHGDAITWELST